MKTDDKQSSDRDILNERLFNTANLLPHGSGLDFMYQAILDIKDLDKQRSYTGQFMLQLNKLKAGAEYTRYKFS